MNKILRSLACVAIVLTSGAYAQAPASRGCLGGSSCSGEHFRLELPVFGGLGVQHLNGATSSLSAGALQLGTRFFISRHSIDSRFFYRILIFGAGNIGGSSQGFTGGGDGRFEATLGVVAGPMTTPAQFASFAGIDASGTGSGGPGAVYSQGDLFARAGAGVRFNGRDGWYVLAAPTIGLGLYRAGTLSGEQRSDGMWMGGDVSLDHPRAAARVRFLRRVFSTAQVAEESAASLASVELTIPVASIGTLDCQGRRSSTPRPDFQNMTVSVSARGDLAVQEQTDGGAQVRAAAFVHVNLHWLELIVRNSPPILGCGWH